MTGVRLSTPVKPGCGTSVLRGFIAVCALGLLGFTDTVNAQQGAFALPDPVALQEVLRIARANRTEIVAAHARVEAARERVTVVSALEDPMLMPSVDHYPYDQMMDSGPDERASGRYDWSIAIEQP
jgi:outer membrane protein TolC